MAVDKTERTLRAKVNKIPGCSAAQKVKRQ